MWHVAKEGKGVESARLGKEIRTLGSMGMDESVASKEMKIRSKMTIVRSKYYKRCKQLLISQSHIYNVS
jgi:hypothetical protein